MTYRHYYLSLSDFILLYSFSTNFSPFPRYCCITVFPFNAFLFSVFQLLFQWRLSSYFFLG
ncbi:hypothetical protein WUBG_15389 [Wuchereria bancrofti]|uniref:Uncharacterized protein n=1 Tax=Wuchereria bancrofti TaxID=6293 RepID=J9E9P8_WUCBA|nr:hypothetical protein WUBG_15389 [Wuchereria bancrofti]